MCIIILDRKMSIYYTGTTFMNKKKQYVGINPRGLYIDFKDEEGNVITKCRNAGQMNWNFLVVNPYLCKYYHKGKKITFQLNPGQFPFTE